MELILVAWQNRSVRRWGVLLLVVLLTLPAMWPFLSHTGYWDSHDGLFHLYRLLSLQEAWQQGNFYPRIFPDFAFGYGFAVLNFYGPFTYYVALVLSGLGLSALVATKLTFALSYPFAGLAIWWFVRDLWCAEDKSPNDFAGMVAAVAYTYIPYHMADVQLRGALAESWAFVWWPLLFWAVWRGRRWTLALSLAALVLTHNLSVVLVAFPLALWTLLSMQRQRERRPLASYLKELALSATIALLITAFYWLPVLLESRYVWISQDVGGLGFASHLAPWHEWIAHSATYQYTPDQGVAADHPLSWAQVALLGLSVLALPALLRRKWRGAVLFWWGMLIVTLFLLTPTSYSLWKGLVFPFGLVQYPWRWLGLTALATAVLASVPFALFRPASMLSRLYLLGLPVGALVALGWLAFSSMQYLPWQEENVDPRQHPAAMWAEDAEAGQVGATWTAEFLPLTVTEQRWALARAPETVMNVGERTPLRVVEAESDGVRFVADVQAEEAGWLVFPRFAYPSMRDTVDGEERPVQPRGALGLAAIEVPEGTHRVSLDAYPLADKASLDRLLWLPPFALGLYGLTRLGRRKGLVAGLGVALLVVALVSTRQPIVAAPPLQAEPNQPLQFGEQAQLLSIRLNKPTARSGEALKVTMLWFNLMQTGETYNTFVHLTAPGGGPPVSSETQHDGEPNMGTVPTSRWVPGQLVEDLHLLVLPEDLAPGQYELWGGIYAIVDGSAVPIPGDSGERRLLATIEVR